MAQKVIVELIDDLGTPIPAGKGESIDFAVDGVGYRIDLGPKNAKAFRKTFDTLPRPRHPHRRAAPAPHPHLDRPSRRDPAQTRAIREWALANGYEISARGRIPTAIEQAYHDAT
jgi:hypothetical protein